MYVQRNFFERICTAVLFFQVLPMLYAHNPQKMDAKKITVVTNYNGHPSVNTEMNRFGRWYRPSVLRPIPLDMPRVDPKDLPGSDARLPHGVVNDKTCHLCSDPHANQSVEHGHYRLNSVKNGQSTYFCPSCKDTHGVGLQSKRRKVVLSSLWRE